MGAYLTILGYNSAIPTVKSSPTAQFLEMDERCFLIDCGEGTQVQLRKAKAKFSKINHIFHLSSSWRSLFRTTWTYCIIPTFRKRPGTTCLWTERNKEDVGNDI